MRNLVIPIFAGILCTSFTFKTGSFVSTKTIGKNDASLLYNSARLADYGLSEEAFNYAYKGYKELETEGKLSNIQYLSICDFSQSSSKKSLTR